MKFETRNPNWSAVALVCAVCLVLPCFCRLHSAFCFCLAADPVSPGYGQTQLFGIEARGTKFVYVFDRSGSMGENHEGRLKAAKAELIKSLADLDPRQQFYVIFYNEEPRLFDPGAAKGRLVFATDENKRQAQRFVESIKADGGTDHTSALVAALRLRPDVIFLLTDGEQQDDPTAADLKRLDRINGAAAQIHVIQFAPTPRPGSTLVELAHMNRGQHVFVDVNKLGAEKTAVVK